jgi:glutamate-5-semialdehyde dehydrogenase
MSEVRDLALRAREAARRLASTSTSQRNGALLAMAEALVTRAPEILEANAADMAAAAEAGTPGPLLDRLMLDTGRLQSIGVALRTLARGSDPIGEVVNGRRLSNGIWLQEVRVPLGVVAMIYEARPNVTADAAGLAVKTGNAVILRGGSLAEHTNNVMTAVLADAVASSGLPRDAVQQIADTSRESASELMGLYGLIDVLIPRGGAGLIRSVVQNAKVPTIETGVGNCHVYVHEHADLDMALRIIINAKVQRPGVCNAAESLVVDHGIAPVAVPRIVAALQEERVEVVGDDLSRMYSGLARIGEATEEDWGTEYLDMKISIKVVDGIDAAIDHINRYGTRHSEAIVTDDYEAAKRFLNEVDAAAVYVNASTRFTDGGEFGLGAEIGISTQKLHARGPMGLTALTTTKWMAMGDGQIRE